MSPNIAQRTLSRGEISPNLNSRVDLAAYFASLSVGRNAIIPRSGGIVNRPGTEFVGETKNASDTPRLIPFVFSADDSYVLEFGNLYMRVIRNGGYVTQTATNIASISQATEGVVTSTAHGYANGDEIFITGVVGMTEVNGLVYIVSDQTANTYKIKYKQSGSYVNTSGFTAYSSAGTAAKIFELTTPYAIADVDELDFAQAQDTIILTHKTYAPRKLVRSGHASWAISVMTFHRYEAPRSATGTVGTAGGKTYNYKISAIFQADGIESLPATASSFTIATASQTNPVQITCTAHPYVAGDEVRIGGVGGMTELNERQFIVATAASNTFTLLNVDGTAYTAFTSGGTVARTHVKITSAGIPTTTSPHVLSWSVPQYVTLTSITQAATYLIYRESGGIYSLIGQTTNTTFSDTNLIANAAYTPLVYNEVFFGAGNYPGRCSFYQQRLLFASSTLQPRTFWGSVIGNYFDFSIHFPIEEDDPFEFTVANNAVTEITNFVNLRRLVLLTDANETAANGDASGALTNSSPNIREYTFNGSTKLKPIEINGSALYVQRQANIVRDLYFDFGSDGYQGSDLTVWNAHLLDGYTITDWTYQKIPNSIIWCVRSDGKLLSLSYMRDQQILGWTRHDTDGTVEGVCAIPEGTETRLYLLVKRTINSVVHRYIERMYSREITDAADIRDNVFMDCAETYDGRQSGSTVTITGASYTAGASVTATASASIFTSAFVGRYVFAHGTDANGDDALVRILIATVNSATSVTGTTDITVPTPMRAAALSTWGIGVTSVRGLWHLEGESIAVMGDGWERANPNMSNSTYATVTVASSIATLSSPHEVLHFGLPYVTQLRTVDIDNPQGQSLMDQNKIVNQVTLYVNNTREFWVGESLPADNSQTNLRPSIAARPSGTYLDAPPTLYSEPVHVPLKADWNKGGRCCIVGVSCYPLEVTAINPHFRVGK